MAANHITTFSPKLYVKSLIHLGASYNKICDDELPKLCQSFPNLFSIDLANNQICNLQTVVGEFSNLKMPRMINLQCNPVVLCNNYRAIMRQKFDNLIKLDGTTAFTDAE